MNVVPNDEAYAFFLWVLDYPVPLLQARLRPADNRNSASPMQINQGIYSFRIVRSENENGIMLGVFRGDKKVDQIEFRSNYTGHSRRLWGVPLFETTESYEKRRSQFAEKHPDGYFAFWEVDQMNLPYWDGSEWSAPVPETRTWLSADRAEHFKLPVFPDERPVGFRFCTPGPPGFPYAPLYDRTIPMERIKQEKFYPWERGAG